MYLTWSPMLAPMPISAAALASSACLASPWCSDICPAPFIALEPLALEPVPKFPKKGVVAQRHASVQVRRPGRAASSRFGTDLPLDHLHVPAAPQRGDLVVGEQSLGEL